ncbi:hypothetical protein CNYM01_05958 [Colletotrichum nymphaeae SA-01]|uniref:Uncharacterized protein n=1 Tax=Colletotrichum nymphaeae SA-01 TaxID=1460502 RepID=A0A135STC1_9PEZI|nr:hypothetical protein CNYM01_05958 [Colletotrichum nymphaeae SA-01]
MFFRHIEKNGPLSDRITDVEVVKNKPRIFDLDEDYAMPPSTSVNNAWSSLIPEEGGFFEHPAITSGTRKATGKIPHMPQPIKSTTVQIPPQMSTPLMTYTMLATALISYAKPSCAAPLTVLHVKDLTVETLEPKFGGVTGFGTKHQCVDWQELMNWMAINESH